MESTAAGIFLKFSADKLDQFAGRIDTCLARLSEEQVWTRGTENENAVGNLALHLCGNLGQWIGTGVAGRPDTRYRDGEFQERGGVGIPELRERLRAAAADTTKIFRELPPERLTERITVQGFEITVLEAIYHAVEHFAMHAGQIMFATKRFTGQGLGFYRHLEAGAAHGEKPP